MKSKHFNYNKNKYKIQKQAIKWISLIKKSSINEGF